MSAIQIAARLSANARCMTRPETQNCTVCAALQRQEHEEHAEHSPREFCELQDDADEGLLRGDEAVLQKHAGPPLIPQIF